MLLRKLGFVLLVSMLALAACKPQTDSPTAVPEPGTDEAATSSLPAETAPEETESLPDPTGVEPALIGLIPGCEAGSWISPVDGARIICIPNGDFPMGALANDLQAEEDETPLHMQEMSNFWLYETEVTNAMFRLFVASTGYTTTAEVNGYAHTIQEGAWTQVNGADWMHPQGQGSDLMDKNDHPVVNISREDAQHYCTWSNDGYLPMEKDWEKAARGTDERLYPWGDTPPTSELANGPGEPYTTTAPVFDLATGVSPYGFYHMSGNAAEWISHRFNPDYYTTGRAYPEGEGYPQQVRGGGWLSETREMRVSDRQPLPPDVQAADFIGFRCMLSYHPPTPVSAGREDGQPFSEGEAPTEACEMLIPTAFEAEVITDENRGRLGEYALAATAGENGDADTPVNPDISLASFWDENTFSSGIFLPGWRTSIKYDYVNGGRIFLYVFLMDGGLASHDTWFMFEFWENATLAMAQDSSVFLFFDEDVHISTEESGSISLTVPGAFCDNKSPSAAPSPVILTGGGVERFDLTANPDGSQRLMIFIKPESYPGAFDEWDLQFLGAAQYLQNYSSSLETSNDTVTSITFTVDLPPGTEVFQDGEFLSIVLPGQ